MKAQKLLSISSCSMLLFFAAAFCHAQSPDKVADRYDALASLDFKQGYPTEQAIQQLKDELLFQRATQAYLWAIPAINMYGMKDGSEKDFGKGYNILPI